jgi:hypothetical protein
MARHQPTFLRWIEEAEARRLREWAMLEPAAARPSIIAPPPTAATVASYPAARNLFPVPAAGLPPAMTGPAIKIHRLQLTPARPL